MSPPPLELRRQAAELRLTRAESKVTLAVDEAITAWAEAIMVVLLREWSEQTGVTAAASWRRHRRLGRQIGRRPNLTNEPTPPLEPGGPSNYQPAAAHAADTSVNAAVADWNRQLDGTVLPSVGVAFGEEFQSVRRSTPGGSYRPQQEYLATVRDRLVIWPQGAFEDLRPELLEALSEAESINQVRDRVGRTLGIDADTRAIKADINQVEKALADELTDPADVPELKALRRQMWEQHDASLPEWQWKARRIARTETHGAVSNGAIAAARETEAETGEVYHKRWLATNDSRTRPEHLVADGQTVRLDEKFTVGDVTLDCPGDTSINAPAQTINCRCTVLYLDPDELQDELAGPDSSLGEIRPGGVRLGPDDPDAARMVIGEVNAEREAEG